MNIIIVFLLTMNVLLFVPGVNAQTVMSGESVIVPSEQVINETYFAGGDSVNISGIINGDAYVAGGTIYVDGTINGDLLVAGGTVNINGEINGDIRGVGGQVNINSDVLGNVTVVAGNINIFETAQIGKGVVCAGGQVNIMAPLGEGAVVAAGQLTLNNVVNGNILAGVGKMILNPNVKINGDVTYYGEEKAVIAKEASITGNLKFHKQKTYTTEKDYNKTKVLVTKGAVAAGAMFSLYSFIVSFISGSLLIKLAPHFAEEVAHSIDLRPWGSMAIGLIAVVVTPFIAFILFISLLGIPFSLLLMVLYFVYLCIAKIFVAMYIGQKIVRKLNKTKNMYLALLMGLVIVFILSMIPIVGWLLQFVFAITGMGALLLVKKEFYKKWQSHGLI